MSSLRNVKKYGALSLLATLAAAPSAGAGPETRTSIFVKGPYIQDLTATSGEVRVEVDPPGPVTLDFGEGGPPGRIEHKESAAFHVFPLTGLSPKTRYRYSAQSGVSKLGNFTTAPADSDKDAVTFLVYGDNRTDDSAHAAIVRTMAGHPADFLLNTGDLVEHGGVPGLWQRFFEIEAPLLSSQCVFPTIGNHELVDRDATLYLRYFGPSATLSDAGGAAMAPAIHRTFRWGLVRVLILGGFGDDVSMSHEKRWLEDELRKADAEPGLVYRIVMTHHGPWSSGPHGSNRSLHDASIVSVLKAHKVSLMLSGHDHIYERGQSGDIPYMVSGGGGAPSYDQKTKLPTTRTFESARHFVEVRATASIMTFTALRSDGSKIEECGIPAAASGPYGWGCDKAAAAAAGASGTTSGATAPSNAGELKTDAAKSTCACSTVGASGAGDAPHARGIHGRSASRAPAFLAFFGLFLLGTRRYARRRCAPPCSP